MLQYTKLLYRNIGRRIKRLRNAKNLYQDGLLKHISYENKSVLSSIENGKAGKDNPYLMSKSFMSGILKEFKISVKDLIWGTREEQETFVKTLLLALIMNGDEDDKYSGNPFFYSEDYDELFHWAKKQKNADSALEQFVIAAVNLIEQDIDISKGTVYTLTRILDSDANEKLLSLEAEIKKATDEYSQNKSEENLLKMNKLLQQYTNLEQQLREDGRLEGGEDSLKGKKIQKQILDYFKKENGFFFDSDNKEDYDLLTKNADGTRIYEKDYECISNLLLKGILNSSTAYTFSFIHRFCNLTRWEAIDNEALIIHRASEYIKDKGQYGLLALDFQERDYHLFIKTFNRFWDRKKEIFLDYFDENLFNMEISENTGLKIINDDLFHKLLTAQELTDLIRKSNVTDMLYEEEAVISSIYQLITLQQYIIMDKMLRCENENDKQSSCYDYVINMQRQTREFAEKYIQNV